MTEVNESTEIFLRSRGKLFGIAYRMLGITADSEDVLQEAYIRWHNAEKEDIRNAEAWLVTIVTRLSIDKLRKTRSARESYIGPWLPEPLITSDDVSPETAAENRADLSLAFMYLLERLSPVERAGFLLHDIFDVGYPQVAKAVGKTEAAVRQLVHRARVRLRTEDRRFDADENNRAELIRRFVQASDAGDEAKLLSLFSDDIGLVADGGGIVSAARRRVSGSRRIARLFAISMAKYSGLLQYVLIDVNGETALLTLFDGKPEGLTTFSIIDGKIVDLYRVMNPEKLRAFEVPAEKNISEVLSQNAVPIRLDH